MALPLPTLCLITDRTLCSSGSLASVVSHAVDGGVNVVQLREKDLPAGALLELAQQLQESVRGRALIIINDRLDVALAAGADGVHLPEAGLPVQEARRLAGDRLLVGRSVHCVEAAIEAADQGADLVQVGTIFPSASHPGVEAAGVELISRVAGQVQTPILGVGGITAATAPQVIGAGAAGVAVIRAILASASPAAAARELRRAVEEAWQAQGQRVVWEP